MYKNNNADFIAALAMIFLIVLVLAIGLGLDFVINSAICTAKTKDMGFNHDYSIFGGCKIEVIPGIWIPFESYYFRQEQ